VYTRLDLEKGDHDSKPENETLLKVKETVLQKQEEEVNRKAAHLSFTFP